MDIPITPVIQVANLATEPNVIESSSEEPKEIDPTDTIEIGSKKWVEVGVVSRNPCDWFIPEHASYLDICLGAIVQFEAFTPEEKVMYRAV